MTIPSIFCSTLLMLLAWIGVMVDPDGDKTWYGKIFRKIGLVIICISVVFMFLSLNVPFNQTPSKTFIVPLEDKGDRQVFKIPIETLPFFVQSNKNVEDVTCSFTKLMGYRTDKKYVRLTFYCNTAYGIDWTDMVIMQACEGPEEKSEKQLESMR